METTKTAYPDEIVSAGQLLRILDSDAKEISTLCQRACLRPKKDGFGNIYFSKGDVDVLRKVKELYEHTRKLQDEKKTPVSLNDSIKVRENKLKKAKMEKKENKEFQKNTENVFNESAFPIKMEINKPEIASIQKAQVLKKLDSIENNVVSKITDVLSEKLDGLDEVIVELIKAKTENETLRQKVNELNKENFSLKSENLSFRPLGLGLYVKKQADDFTF